LKTGRKYEGGLSGHALPLYPSETCGLLCRIAQVWLMQDSVLWVVTLCYDVVGYQCFGGPCCLHLRVKWMVLAKGH